MADTDINQARSDEELVASDEDAASAAARSMMKALCVSGPGIVDGFDAATQTAKVRVAIKRNFASLGWVETVCVDVPVVFPAGGQLVLTFPIGPGDEGILIFGDRAIDNWFANGGVQEASEIRFHDPSDAMFVPGISSKPRALQSFNETAAELRTRDGAVIFRAVPGSGGGGGGSGSVQAAVLSDALLECIQEMSFATGVGPTGIGPLNLAAFKAKIKSLVAFVGA